MTTRSCSRCGYDLRGLPPTGRCPECGEAYDLRQRQHVRVTDTPQCKRCDYELLGLPGRGQCPECGLDYDIPRRKGIRLPETPEQRGSRYARRFVTIALTLLGVTVITAGIALTVYGNLDKAIWIGGFFGVMILLWAGINYLGEKDE